MTQGRCVDLYSGEDVVAPVVVSAAVTMVLTVIFMARHGLATHSLGRAIMGVTKLSVVMWTIFGITLRLWMHVAVAGPLGNQERVNSEGRDRQDAGVPTWVSAMKFWVRNRLVWLQLSVACLCAAIRTFTDSVALLVPAIFGSIGALVVFNNLFGVVLAIVYAIGLSAHPSERWVVRL